MSVASDINMETILMEMETKFKGNQSLIAEIMKLLTPGMSSNPTINVKLVLAAPLGGAGK